MKTKHYLFSLLLLMMSKGFSQPVIIGYDPAWLQAQTMAAENETISGRNALSNIAYNENAQISDISDAAGFALTARTNHVYHTAILNWKAGRKANVRYEILRSENDGNSWEKIGELSCYFNDSNTTLEFTDIFPGDRNYYKVRVIENDSNTLYSNKAPADFTIKQPSVLTSFSPNPPQGNFSFAVKTKCYYEIKNTDQEVIYKGELNGQIIIQNLPNGTYFLSLFSDSNIETYTILIQ